MSKAEIREEILRKRSLFPAHELAKKGSGIAKNFFSLKEFSGSGSFGVYVSFRNEAETRGIINTLLEAGKKVFVPVTDFRRKEIYFSALRHFSELHENKVGVLEPSNPKKVDPKKIDVFVVPGIAFDLEGHRLGWGKGLYDRFFSQNGVAAKKIGLAYDFQVAEKLPNDSLDVKMGVVVTETRVIRP